ncbi:MAG: ATP-grasp domain-containing protein [Thiobacillus sp.]|nr:ATP-grasp domain-containing protein [Thiobacillus sp.]
MPSKAFLVTSLSGRVLAKAAVRAKRPVMGVDAFADRDTCGVALKWMRIPLDHNSNVEPAEMLKAINSLCPQAYCLGLVYGSGFEARPDLLRSLAKGRPLLGNVPGVLETVADPARFANLLVKLNIPHPVTVMSRPEDTTGWLSKLAGACGGTHVSFASCLTEDNAGRYFQQQVDGEEWSFLFLANGREICPVGFNQPIVTPPQAPGHWSYSGATRLNSGPAGIAEAVLDAARALTGKLGLIGLNGLDFIVTNNNGWVLLELNPRPTATLELWDVPPLPPLFDLHIEACNGRLPAKLPQPTGSMAVAVAYAEKTLYTHDAFTWPSWCADLPWADSVIEAGDPVCTVRAEGMDAASAKRQVLARRREILDQLARFHSSSTDKNGRIFTQHDLMLPA